VFPYILCNVKEGCVMNKAVECQASEWKRCVGTETLEVGYSHCSSQPRSDTAPGIRRILNLMLRCVMCSSNHMKLSQVKHVELMLGHCSIIGRRTVGLC
jgi:hypothetical protein